MPDQILDIPQSQQSASEVDDLIGNPPGWILRSGIGIIAFVTIVLIAITTLIRYPDKISASGHLHASSPPVTQVAPVSAIIDSIYIADNQIVKRGDPLIYLHNTVELSDLHVWTGYLNAFNAINNHEDYISLAYPSDLVLGIFMPEYAQLQLRVAEFQQTLKQSGVLNQIQTLTGEMQKTNSLRQVLLKEKEFTAQDLSLKQNDHLRNTQLHDDKVISSREKEQSQTMLLQTEKQFTLLESGILNNSIREAQLKTEILRLQEERSNKISSELFAIRELINSIRQKIKDWDETYIVRSLIDGIVQLSPDITPNTFTNAGTPLLSVIPYDAGSDKFARIIVPANGIGRIGTGTKAIIKLDAYPYKEFGVVNSEVSSIAALPVKNEEGAYQYEIRLSVADTMLTSYKNKIPWQPLGLVSVDLITEDRSIFERIFQQFLDLIKNR